MSIVDGLNNIAQLVSPFAQSIDAFTAGLSIWGIIVIVYFSVLPLAICYNLYKVPYTIRYRIKIIRKEYGHISMDSYEIVDIVAFVFLRVVIYPIAWVGFVAWYFIKYITLRPAKLLFNYSVREEGTHLYDRKG